MLARTPRPGRATRATRAIRGASLALLLGGPLAGAQVSDTLSARPLFTYRDAVLAAALVVGTVAVFPFDKHYAQQLQDTGRQDNRFYRGTATTVRTITEPGAFFIGGVLYVGGRLGHNERMADLGWHGTEAVVVGSLVTGVIKSVVGRGRPYQDPAPDGKPNPRNFGLFRGLRNGNYQSFPSGHTTAAFAAAAAVTSETSRWWPDARVPIGVVLYGGATLTGLSRMYNNKHWASDVMAGALVGTFSGLKVVRYSHGHPGNTLDRWILGARIVPGEGLSLSLLPATRAQRRAFSGR